MRILCMYTINIYQHTTIRTNYDYWFLTWDIVHKLLSNIYTYTSDTGFWSLISGNFFFIVLEIVYNINIQSKIQVLKHNYVFGITICIPWNDEYIINYNYN